jgi:catechol 2,3-dioxygenase-like lactoylglutathione lyase family enzyme
MRLAHLALPVQDYERSLAFYARYFNFDPTTARTYEDGTVTVRNSDGFDLALHPVKAQPPSPEFLHFGFRLSTADAVRTVLASLDAAGVPVVERCEEPGLVSFKCLDPDGWRVEVYWEPIPT